MGSLIQGHFSLLPTFVLSDDAASSGMEEDHNTSLGSDGGDYPSKQGPPVLDFNKFMAENRGSIRDIQKERLAQQMETNRALRAQACALDDLCQQIYEQTDVLKEAIIEVNDISQKEVEGLRLELGQFREQLNLRLDQMETNLEVSNARDHQRWTKFLGHSKEQSEINAEVTRALTEIANVLTDANDQPSSSASGVVPGRSVSGTFANLPVVANSSHNGRRASTRLNKDSTIKAASAKEECGFCGKLLGSKYLSRHVKDHCPETRRRTINN